MKCPYCEKEMEKGYIPTARSDAGLVWFPESAKRPVFMDNDKVKKLNGVVLNQPNFGFGDYRIEVHICRRCAKGVFSYDPYAQLFV